MSKNPSGRFAEGDRIRVERIDGTYEYEIDFILVPAHGPTGPHYALTDGTDKNLVLEWKGDGSDEYALVEAESVHAKHVERVG